MIYNTEYTRRATVIWWFIIQSTHVELQKQLTEQKTVLEQMKKQTAALEDLPDSAREPGTRTYNAAIVISFS